MPVGFSAYKRSYEYFHRVFAVEKHRFYCTNDFKSHSLEIRITTKKVTGLVLFFTPFHLMEVEEWDEWNYQSPCQFSWLKNFLSHFSTKYIYTYSYLLLFSSHDFLVFLTNHALLHKD